MNSYWLHGWATDRLVFKEIVDRLPAPFNSGAKSCDLPGFGAARPLGKTESYAGRILGEIAAVSSDGEGVALAGWSLGALVALEAAYALGEKLRALVLISACGRFSRSMENPHGTDPRRIEVMRRRLEKGYNAEVLEEFFRSMFHSCDPCEWERFRQEFRPGYLDQSPEPLAEGLRYLAEADPGVHARRINAPVLILHGGRDVVIDRRCARALERALPNAGLVLFEDAGHMPFLGRENDFAALIGDFFKAGTSGQPGDAGFLHSKTSPKRGAGG